MKFRQDWIRICCFLMRSGQKRTQYLVKQNYFSQGVGDGFVFFPRKIPRDPEFIKFHNNVVVATDVMFVNHDIIHDMLNGEEAYHEQGKSQIYKKHYACIEIVDNVFIGARTLIMPNIKIGPNTIIAAGSVVTKSCRGGVVLGGNPAKVIGSYAALKEKRLKESSGNTKSALWEDMVDSAWNDFRDEDKE